MPPGLRMACHTQQMYFALVRSCLVWQQAKKGPADPSPPEDAKLTTQSRNQLETSPHVSYISIIYLARINQVRDEPPPPLVQALYTYIHN